MTNFTTDGKICIQRELQINNSTECYEDILKQFEVIETCKWIEENKFNKVCLQFPDELLNVSSLIYEEIKNRIDVDLYILADTSYGSCCVDSVSAMHVCADCVVHYGHTCFSSTNIPVYTVLSKNQIDIPKTMDIISSNFNGDQDKLCLFYDADFEHCKSELEMLWYRQYPNSYIAYIELQDKPTRCNGRIVKDVNGDEISFTILKECTCIYIGVRSQTLFNHSVTIAAKEWYCINLNIPKVERLDQTMWFKRRRYLVEKCKDANVIGILVCQLAGERTKDIIARIKQLCRVNGKKSYIVSVGKPNVAKLANFPEIDIYVMIACPENDLYNNRDFYKPLVYPFELEVALNSNRDPYFTSHVSDYNQLLPGNRHYCDIGQVTDSVDVSLITGNIRETRLASNHTSGMELAEKQNWALQSIGDNLQDRSWKGLEQKLGETEVKEAEEGRRGIPLQYSNEPA